MAYINFTSFVTNDDIETPTQETVKNFDCIVEVFRSKDNCGGGWGKNDNMYKQNFGFDRYNQETSGKGLGATQPFKFMHFLKNSSDGIISYVYYIPWLCIWPPKASLQDFYKKNSSKKEEGKWIDPSFIPVSEAELFCRIDGGKDKKKDSGDLVFISNSEHLKVEGGKTYSLTGKSVKDEFSIKISCSGVIKNDPKNPPKIEIRETGEKGAIVGQINVVPNDEIYFGRVFFVPIEREKKEAKRKGQAERRKQEKEEFNKLVQEILVYLNTKSFNQALIYFDADASEIITFPKNLIKSGSVGEYSASVSKAYFQGIPGTNDSEHKKKLKDSKKELDKAISTYYNAIKKNYNNLQKKETYYLSKTMEGVSEEIVEDYKKKSEEHLKLLEGEILVDKHLRMKSTIYAFVDKDRDILSDGGFNYGAYAYQGGEDAYIFNKSVENEDYGVIAHEIAHTLNLFHIYDLDSKKINKSIDENIKELEEKAKNSKNAEKKSGEAITNKDVVDYQENFNTNYNNMEIMINYSDGYMDKYHKTEKEYYRDIDQVFYNFIKYANKEKDYIIKKSVETNYASIDPKIEFQKKIDDYKKIKAENLKKEVVISMSRSLENFMDYDSYLVEKSQPEKSVESVENEDFSYRSFCKWQWDKMKQSIRLHKRTLK